MPTARPLLAAALLLTVACDGVSFGRDPLAQLPPRERQLCRDAVNDALASKNVGKDWIESIRFREVRGTTRGRGRLVGFEAWVRPKEGGGAIVVELSVACQVTSIWARGLR
ncbi:MAG: hypothetical protein QNJ67_09650 [Kiloniellales bacterium]|nr:hypothetical protein [Kiloniellales bacterium]